MGSCIIDIWNRTKSKLYKLVGVTMMHPCICHKRPDPICTGG